MTSSDLMIETISKFSSSEATSVIVIWTDDNGDIQATSNATKTQIMGMCEFTKLSTFNSMVPK